MRIVPKQHYSKKWTGSVHNHWYWLYLWILLADSPGRTSCHAIVGLTLELSPTSAPSARRNLPAAITCPNTSKSIAFHEAAGQRALHTDPTQPPAMERERDRKTERTNERKKERQIHLWYCDNLLREARMNWRRVCSETVTWLVGLTDVVSFVDCIFVAFMIVFYVSRTNLFATCNVQSIFVVLWGMNCWCICQSSTFLV